MCNVESSEGKRLCRHCTSRGRTSCLFEESIDDVQATVPTEIKTRKDLRAVLRANRSEKLLHEEARRRDCPYHNDRTLTLPRLPED